MSLIEEKHLHLLAILRMQFGSTPEAILEIFPMPSGSTPNGIGRQKRFLENYECHLRSDIRGASCAPTGWLGINPARTDDV
jgi:hypothetical protein